MIDNDDALNAMVMKDLYDIIDEVTDQLLEKLKEKIDEEVYGAGTPSKKKNGYIRRMDNGGLRGSFEKSSTIKSMQSVTNSIEHFPENMDLDSDNNVHGSNFWEGGKDIRSILVDMIINGGSGTPHVGDRFGGGFWTDSRDFWTPFLEMLTDGTVNKLIESAFDKRGIVWIRG